MARNSTALVQTFEKGLQLLEYLVEHKVVSVTSIAKLMGIQKSASYRFLNTLRLHGYVEQDQHNNYILTDKVSKMGNGIVPRMEFRHIVSRFLDELAKRNCKDGICNLGKWNGKEIVYEVQSANLNTSSTASDGRFRPTVPPRQGHPCPPAGSSPRHLHPADADGGFTEKTCTTEERLRAELQEVRERGYAIMDGELYLRSRASPFRSSLETGGSNMPSAPHARSTAPLDSLIEDMLVPLQETAHDIVEYIKFYHFD